MSYKNKAESQVNNSKPWGYTKFRDKKIESGFMKRIFGETCWCAKFPSFPLGWRLWGTSPHLELGERGFNRATEKYGMCGLQVGIGGLVSDFYQRSRKGGKCKRCGFDPWVGKIPWRHDNPLQYSHLENPMDRGAWRATVHGVAKSRTRLKPLSTSVSKRTTDERATTVQSGRGTSFRFLKAWGA